MKYSIIIPVHNAQKTIKDTINSILMQSVSNYEVIVVNDASTDNTSEILQEIRDTKNIKIINLDKNRKAGGARNEGINKAKGDYIIFLDADDTLEERAIEKIDRVIGKSEPDVVYLGFKIKKTQERIIPNKHNSIKENRLSDWKYENVWDICWNRNFLDKNNIRFVENRYFEDFLFYYKGVVLSQTYRILEDITHIYTQDREGSMTTDISLKKLEDLYYNTVLLIRFINTIPIKYHKCILEGIHRNNNYINQLIDKYEEKSDKE